MLYGPDTLLAGAAAVTVAGQRNGVAIAGLVNGIASLGPVLQEPINGKLLAGSSPAVAIRYSNLMGLSMSIAFVVFMAIISLRIVLDRRRNNTESPSASEPRD